MAAAALAPQNDPAGQTRQSVAPFADWYVPGAHDAQLPCAVVAAYVPGLHILGTMLRSEQLDPAGHARQAVAPDCDWYVPAAHATHTPAPGLGAMVPGSHTTALTAPTVHAEPAGHVLQLVCCAASWKVPASHNMPTAEPRGQYAPRGHGKGVCVAAPQKKPDGHGPLHEERDWELTVVLSDHLPGAHGKGKSSSKGPFVIVVTYWLRVSGYRVRFHGC